MNTEIMTQELRDRLREGYRQEASVDNRRWQTVEVSSLYSVRRAAQELVSLATESLKGSPVWELICKIDAEMRQIVPETEPSAAGADHAACR